MLAACWQVKGTVSSKPTSNAPAHSSGSCVHHSHFRPLATGKVEMATVTAPTAPHATWRSPPLAVCGCGATGRQFEPHQQQKHPQKLQHASPATCRSSSLSRNTSQLAGAGPPGGMAVGTGCREADGVAGGWPGGSWGWRRPQRGCVVRRTTPVCILWVGRGGEVRRAS